MLEIIFSDINDEVVNYWNEWKSILGIGIFSDINLKIIKHSIVDLNVNAVVSPANCLGHLGGGVDGVYRKFFGRQLQDRIYKRLTVEDLSIGEPFAVDSGLHHRLFILSPTMDVPGSIIDPTSDIPYIATESVLNLIKNSFDFYKKDFSVAFPGMGTGVGGFPIENACYQMVDAVANFATELNRTTM